jgi:hypothetical protein
MLRNGGYAETASRRVGGPLATVLRLNDLRDAIAHGKAQRFSHDTDPPPVDDGMPWLPTSTIREVVLVLRQFGAPGGCRAALRALGAGWRVGGGALTCSNRYWYYRNPRYTNHRPTVGIRSLATLMTIASGESGDSNPAKTAHPAFRLRDRETVSTITPANTSARRNSSALIHPFT